MSGLCGPETAETAVVDHRDYVGMKGCCKRVTFLATLQKSLCKKERIGQSHHSVGKLARGLKTKKTTYSIHAKWHSKEQAP